jgi:hypothetical protein
MCYTSARHPHFTVWTVVFSILLLNDMSYLNYISILSAFGTQTTPAPPALKALPKIFAHSDKTVRAEGTALVHIFYQFIGSSIEPWLADLKPVQVKELKEAFEGMDKDGKGKGSLKPERHTRQQAREVVEVNDIGDVDDAQGEQEGNAFPHLLSPTLLTFVKQMLNLIRGHLRNLSISSQNSRRLSTPH